MRFHSAGIEKRCEQCVCMLVTPQLFFVKPLGRANAQVHVPILFIPVPLRASARRLQLELTNDENHDAKAKGGPSHEYFGF